MSNALEVSNHNFDAALELLELDRDEDAEPTPPSKPTKTSTGQVPFVAPPLSRSKSSTTRFLHDSFRVANATTAHITGFSLAASTRLVILAIAIFTLGFGYVTGPEFLLASVRTIDAVDGSNDYSTSGKPICNGSQFFWACDCDAGHEADGSTWSEILSKQHCTKCDVNEFKEVPGNVGCTVSVLLAAFNSQL